MHNKIIKYALKNLDEPRKSVFARALWCNNINFVSLALALVWMNVNKTFNIRDANEITELLELV